MFLGDYFTTDVKPQLWGDISLIATIKKKKKKKKDKLLRANSSNDMFDFVSGGK